MFKISKRKGKLDKLLKQVTSGNVNSFATSIELGQHADPCSLAMLYILMADQPPIFPLVSSIGRTLDYESCDVGSIPA